MAKTYTVQAGDNLTVIAKKFNTTIEDLVTLNKVRDKNLIYVGQVLKIPEAQPTTKPTQTTTSKDFASVGRAFENCIKAIENLEEFKTLSKLL